MRIADKMGYDQVQSNLSKNRSEMADLQNQAATQKRVTKPSDDPLAATRVLQTKTDIASGQQFLKSVGQARMFLEYSEQSLGELSEAISRAKELALSQANDPSSNEISRLAVASEIDQLFGQAVQIGNRKVGDRFMFGGFKTTRPPFDGEGNYKGDSGEMKISIQKEGSIAMNMPGDQVFIGKSDNPNIQHKSPPKAPPTENPTEIRGPASKFGPTDEPAAAEDEGPIGLSASWSGGGVNVFHVFRGLATGLRANDKVSVQESLDQLDSAMSQVVLARSQLGSRVSTLTSAMESLQKGQVDAKALKSNLEDVDTFELVSDINKTESTLKATLATSGKLMQPSLLDFLR